MLERIIAVVDEYCTEFMEKILLPDSQYAKSSGNSYRIGMKNGSSILRVYTDQAYHNTIGNMNGGINLSSERNRTDKTTFYEETFVVYGTDNEIQWSSIESNSKVTTIIDEFNEETHFQLSTIHSNVPSYQDFIEMYEVYKYVHSKYPELQICITMSKIKTNINYEDMIIANNRSSDIQRYKGGFQI